MGLARIDREDELVDAARTGDEEAFGLLAGRYRLRVKSYCYRMLGSVFDAEDATQDTLVRAWRAMGTYARRAAFRTWLFTIATNVCRTRLKGAHNSGVLRTPYPDTEIEDSAAGPQTIVDQVAGMEIAFVIATQLLPPRQRAVLILREALEWSAVETANVLETTVPAVNSALQRARARLDGRIPPAHEPKSTDIEHRLATAFSAAWQSGDLAGLATILSEDVTLKVPDRSLQWDGRDDVTAFFASLHPDGDIGALPLVATTANGQPAFGDYHDSSQDHRPHGIMVLTVSGSKISSISGFDDPALFAVFGLPATPPR